MKVKTPKEILVSIRELTHRHWKRWLKAQAKTVDTCVHVRSANSRCSNCVTVPGSGCVVPESFAITAEEKQRQRELFREDINNPAKLIRDYRDVAMLLWALGLLDERDSKIPIEERVVDEALRLAGEPPPTELKIALNFPVDESGYINLGNNDRIKASDFVDAMKRFQEKKPEKVILVHERVQSTPERPVVVGHPKAGPKDGRALPEVGVERPKLVPGRRRAEDDPRPKVGTDEVPDSAESH
jgi:hypothetical protein